MTMIESTVCFSRGPRTEIRLTDTPAPPSGRVPLISRLMALAIHYEDLLRAGTVESLAELARLGHVSRTRISQVMNLLHLAPEIQERLLFLPLVERGDDPIFLRDMQKVARCFDWKEQRQKCQTVLGAQLPIVKRKKGRVGRCDVDVTEARIRGEWK